MDRLRQREISDAEAEWEAPIVEPLLARRLAAGASAVHHRLEGISQRWNGLIAWRRQPAMASAFTEYGGNVDNDVVAPVIAVDLWRSRRRVIAHAWRRGPGAAPRAAERRGAWPSG